MSTHTPEPQNAEAPASTSNSTSSGSRRKGAPPPLQVAQPAPEHVLAAYPNFALRPYAPRAPARPPNVLALLHNALRRELLDLHVVLLPYLRHASTAEGAAPQSPSRRDPFRAGGDGDDGDNGDDDTDNDNDDEAANVAVTAAGGDAQLSSQGRQTTTFSSARNSNSSGDSVPRAPPRVLDEAALRAWWGTLLRFAFFVAENDEHIAALVVEPAAKAATRRTAHHLAGSLRQRQRSLADRYNFAMEHVFRAADAALRAHLCVLAPPTPASATSAGATPAAAAHGATEAEAEEAEEAGMGSLLRAEMKVKALVTFLLDAMAATDALVAAAERECEVDVVALEASVADGVAAFAAARRPVFLFLCCRWMDDEQRIRAWVTQFGGFRARLFYDAWRKMYFDEHGDVVDAMAEVLAVGGNS